VICDEFGYVSFDKQGAELLFNHLSLRTGRKSTIITTNLGFDRREEVFGDTPKTIKRTWNLFQIGILLD
ncbi:MAG TPA: ATP-binding protein, partial [Acetivibrio sp.]|nr:ATP-binding protein [Acetivibrio sp.]